MRLAFSIAVHCEAVPTNRYLDISFILGNCLSIKQTFLKEICSARGKMRFMLLYQLSTPACQTLGAHSPIAIVTKPAVTMAEIESLLKRFPILASSSALIKMQSSGYKHMRTRAHMRMHAHTCACTHECTHTSHSFGLIIVNSFNPCYNFTKGIYTSFFFYDKQIIW